MFQLLIEAMILRDAPLFLSQPVDGLVRLGSLPGGPGAHLRRRQGCAALGRHPLPDVLDQVPRAAVAVAGPAARRQRDGLQHDPLHARPGLRLLPQ